MLVKVKYKGKPDMKFKKNHEYTLEMRCNHVCIQLDLMAFSGYKFLPNPMTYASMPELLKDWSFVK